jgi:hypothetical protein
VYSMAPFVAPPVSQSTSPTDDELVATLKYVSHFRFRWLLKTDAGSPSSDPTSRVKT